MEKILIIEGEKIHNVGYRPFLLAESLKRKKITNFEAENLEKDEKQKDEKQKVIISMVGDEQKILEFVEHIKNNFPSYAKNCKILSEEDRCPSEVMHINDFRDVLAVEQQNNIVQGGLKINDKLDNIDHKLDKLDNIDHKLDNLITGMHEDFDKMDKKYDKVSQKIGSIDSRMESIDSSIKDLANAIRTFAEALKNDADKKNKTV